MSASLFPGRFSTTQVDLSPKSCRKDTSTSTSTTNKFVFEWNKLQQIIAVGQKYRRPLITFLNSIANTIEPDYIEYPKLLFHHLVVETLDILFGSISNCFGLAQCAFILEKKITLKKSLASKFQKKNNLVSLFQINIGQFSFWLHNEAFRTQLFVLMQKIGSLLEHGKLKNIIMTIKQQQLTN
jgi:hypothetical protein